MPREAKSPEDRIRAQVDHGLASVRPVHDAMGLAPDADRAREIVEFYSARPKRAIPGSVSAADAMFLAEMIRAVRPRTIVEVGVAAGCSTALLAWTAATLGLDARILALDALDRWYIDPAHPVGFAVHPMLASHPGAFGSIAIHTGRTALDAASLVSDGSVDLAFIDADHRHPWPTIDALALLPVMRSGGWILAHDTRLEQIAARHTRTTGDPVPWSHHGPANLHRDWPGRRIHAATESANVGALQVDGDIESIRSVLVAAIDASPWEIDRSDPMVRSAVERVRPTAPIRIASPNRDGARGDGHESVRIALVSREFPPAFGGGIGTAMAHTAASLAAAGHRVHIVTESDSQHDRTEHSVDGVTVHRIAQRDGAGDWWASRARFAARAATIVQTIAGAEGIDVCEFPECEAPGLVHALAQSRSGQVIPTVVQLHTPTEVLHALRSGAYDAPCASLWSAIAAERAAVGLADGVYAPSRFIAEWAHQWWRLDEMPAVVAYPHVPVLDPVRPVPGGGPRVVLYAGRLEPRKGVVMLARAWDRIAMKHPDAVLVLAGADTSHTVTGGSVRRRMLEELSEPARQRVLFAGPVPPAQLRGLIDRSSVCVVPSLWENFPNVAIEAMGHGRPIVASDHGGMAEMIAASDGGIVFPTGDVHGLAAALGRMLGEPVARLRERGASARTSIERTCDPIETTNQRIAVYRTAIARAPKRDAGSREAWIELGEASLRATTGDGDALERQPVPVFSRFIRQWVADPKRPTISAA